MKATFLICGAGGIGRAAALILLTNPSVDAEIYLGDVNEKALQEALKWIHDGMSSERRKIHLVKMPVEGISNEFKTALKNSDVLMDCLPGSLAPKMAGLALDFKCHYVNLTEYVKETNEIKALAEHADQSFILQTGLAPGYINILARRLYDIFKERYDSEQLEHMKMRVGAMSEHALAPSYYAYTWSTIGVATEYLKDSIVVVDNKVKRVPSLSDIQDIIINGEQLQDSYTSGGAADLPDAFCKKIKNLEYRTLRYPGHFKWVKNIIAEMPDHDNSPNKLDLEMRKVIPSVEDDRVVLFAHVSGFDQSGVLRAIEKSNEVLPVRVGRVMMRAIQATTASAMCEAAYLTLKGCEKGVILQSMIDPEEFLGGPFVSDIYGKIEIEA